MMKQPKCRLCGAEHGLGVRKSSGEAVGSVVSGGRGTPGAVKGGEPGPEGKFDRSAYQRDYMAAKRAAAKLGLTVKEYRERHGVSR